MRLVRRALRLLHLAPESKFLDDTVRNAEAAFPGTNRFRIRRPARGLEQRLLRALRAESGGGYFQSQRQRGEDFDWCDVVFVHWLGRRAVSALRTLPDDKALVWCCWGGDHYRIAPGTNSLLLAETQALADGTQGLKLRWPQRRGTVPTWFRRIAPRIDRFCSILPEPPFTAVAPVLSGRRLPEFPYYSEASTFRQGPNEMRGDDILLGNSATLENNHLDALTMLARLGTGPGRIIIPLSYGDSPTADAVTARARLVFGDRAVVLRGWLPIAEYNSTISGCGITVMNHVRAQAVGNLANAIYKGSKVFLRRESPLYAHFRDLGAAVFAFDTDLEPAAFRAPLAPEVREANRAAIRRAYSDAAVTDRIRAIAEDAVRAAEVRRSGIMHAGRWHTELS
jgi:dTDP-N-acetylfucosamine:lipid II N-acetylfucosaminyltransferase